MPRKAKAALCRAHNTPVTVESISVDPPKRGEVTVKLGACGVCHSDLSAITGTIALPLPLVLGHEGAGVVEELGEGVTDLAKGDHVVFSFIYMCGKCRFCVAGRPVLCLEQGKALTTPLEGTPRVRDASGAPLNIFSGCGSMAQYATVSAENLIRIDAKIPLDCAALVGCGGVGLSVIQGAHIAGAERIIAIDTLQPKLEMAKKFGATDTILSSEDVVKSLKKMTGGGPDYAFECVGSGELAGAAYRAIRRGGLAVVVGVAQPSDLTSVRTMTLPFEEKTLTGSYFGSCVPRVDFPRMLALYMAGRLKLDELITRRYSIDEAPQAFCDLQAGKNARGVIVF